MKAKTEQLNLFNYDIKPLKEQEEKKKHDPVDEYPRTEEEGRAWILKNISGAWHQYDCDNRYLYSYINRNSIFYQFRWTGRFFSDYKSCIAILGKHEGWTDDRWKTVINHEFANEFMSFEQFKEWANEIAGKGNDGIDFRIKKLCLNRTHRAICECGYPLGAKTPHCPWCGTKLDWSDVND